MTPPPTSDIQTWASSIGLLIINFGALDLLMHDFLEAALPSAEFLQLKERPFFDRAGRINEHVSGGKYSEETKESFAKFFRRLDPVRELRNHVAHGVARLGLAEDQKTWVLTLTLPKDLAGADSAAPAARHLEFHELASAQNELVKLIEEFRSLSERFEF